MSARVLSARWHVSCEMLFGAMTRALRANQRFLAEEAAAELYLSGYAGGVWNQLEIVASADVGLAQPDLAMWVRGERLRWEEDFRFDVQETGARTMLIAAVHCVSVAPTSLLVRSAAAVALRMCDPVHCSLSDLSSLLSAESDVLRLMDIGGKCRGANLCTECNNNSRALEDVLRRSACTECNNSNRALSELLNGFERALREQGQYDLTAPSIQMALLYRTEQLYLRERQKEDEPPALMDVANGIDGSGVEKAWEIMKNACSETQRGTLDGLHGLYRFHRARQSSHSERFFLYQAVLCTARNPQPTTRTTGTTPLLRVEGRNVTDLFASTRTFPEWSGKEFSSSVTPVRDLWYEDVIETDTLGINPFREKAAAWSIEDERLHGSLSVSVRFMRDRIRYPGNVSIVGDRIRYPGNDARKRKDGGSLHPRGREEEEDGDCTEDAMV